MGGLALCFLLSLSAGKLWLGELLVHFMSQYLWIAAILFCFALYIRHIALSCAGAILTIASLAFILWSNGQTASFTKDGIYEASFTLASYNKYYANPNGKRISKWLRQDDAPDILVIHEIGADEVEPLIKDNPDYPYTALMNGTKYPRNRSLLLSRFPVQDAKVKAFTSGDAEREYLKAKIVPPQKLGLPAFTLFVMHPKTPLYPENRIVRNDEFAKVAEDAAKTEGPVVIAGDMNCTSFSPAFKDFSNKAKVRFITSTVVPEPSWPAQLILAPFQIRIDHILVSDDLQASEMKRLPAMDSDHYPIEVRLHPAPPSAEKRQ
ncbi:MAG: endonuclease/exonuclease/phosphatase family protein [Pseudobdellovibrionaceae bacterium]